MAFRLGLYDSPRKLVENLSSVTDIPEKIKVVDSSTGFINEGTDKQRLWANLIAVDTEIYKQFQGIGQEEYCPTFKIKLKNYKGESLISLIGSEISFSHSEVAFIFDKYKQPVGLALILDFSSISILKGDSL